VVFVFRADAPRVSPEMLPFRSHREELSKIRNAEHSEMHAQQGSQSSHHLRGAVFSCKRFPRVRKKRVPGANVRARLRRGQPEGLQGT